MRCDGTQSSGMMLSAWVCFLPLLDGIDVPEEQQELPGAVPPLLLLLLLPAREQQVVAGHTQRSSARAAGSHPQHHVLHIGRLNVLGKLHLPSSHTSTITHRAGGATKALQTPSALNPSVFPARSDD